MMYRYTGLLRQTASNPWRVALQFLAHSVETIDYYPNRRTHTHTHTERDSSFWSLLTWHEIMNCCLREQLHLCAQPGQTQIFDKKWYYSITPRASRVCTSRLCAENGLASHPNRILAFLQLTWQDANFWSWLVGNVECRLVTRARSLLSCWHTRKKNKIYL